MISELYHKINQSTAARKSRVMVSNFAMKNESNLTELVEFAYDTMHENHVKAFWSLELVAEKKLKLFTIYINGFCEVLPKLKQDSAVRSATKISLFLVKSNQRKNGIDLSQEQEHNIIEALIDRLIQDEKVAAKVYSMKALFVLGKKYNWIYDELKPIITQDAFEHTAAYQTCARNILKKIDKQK